MHGARAGAPRGNGNAVKHGLYRAEAIEMRREIAMLTKQARNLAKSISGCDLDVG